MRVAVSVSAGEESPLWIDCPVIISNGGLDILPPHSIFRSVNQGWVSKALPVSNGKVSRIKSIVL